VTESSTEFSTTSDGLRQLRRRWKPTNEARAAMLLVHGIGEHSGRYEHVGQAFAEAGIDVLAFDQRGFGETGGRRAYIASFSHFLDDIKVLLDERRSLDVPVVLMGHSLGGLIATDYLVSDRMQPDLAILRHRRSPRRCPRGSDCSPRFSVPSFPVCASPPTSTAAS
jgi:alpha-beta hydrolase superfamily lysophospholipase